MFEVWNKPGTGLPPSIPKAFVFTIAGTWVRDLFRWEQVASEHFIRKRNFWSSAVLRAGSLLVSFSEIYRERARKPISTNGFLLARGPCWEGFSGGVQALRTVLEK